MAESTPNGRSLPKCPNCDTELRNFELEFQDGEPIAKLNECDSCKNMLNITPRCIGFRVEKWRDGW